MEGKNVLITGATRGIGKAVALAWAQAGASGIVITGRARDLLAAVSAEINKISPKTKVLALTSEATSEAGTKELWAQVKSEIGIIDVLICNAGVFSEKGSFPKTGKIPPSQWWSDMVSNIHRHSHSGANCVIGSKCPWSVSPDTQLSSATHR